jgi:FtsP/CotA-like multicopper oxidase with cupredoxin domain
MRMNKTITLTGLAGAALLLGICPGMGAYVAPPPLVPGVNYLLPNYANSPVLTKFVDSLPGLTPAGANNLGNYIPVAQAEATVPAGVPTDAAYYEIALVDYLQQLHSELPATKLRGYVQIVPPGKVPPAGAVALTYPGGGAITFPDGTQVWGYDKPRYLGPTIVAAKGTPTRIKFYNLLPAGAAGNLFIPTDVTVMGAGMGPDGTSYTQNRATLHLHGGDNPWVSDGTAHQWITPAGETGTLTNGVSMRNVPDMPIPAKGSATFYWPNGQSGRLMFYHDHAFGMTRLDVYAGEAAGYLLVDPTERTLSTLAPGGEIPLVIQDKTFVNDGVLPAGFPAGAPAPAATSVVDPLWASNPNWGQTRGSLWFPHVYMPNQNPNDISGANPLGRWDYGAWFWPIFPSGIPPQVTAVPEAFVDTPMVNGAVYPYLNVQPAAYRFRVLNACNDRYVNLQLYVASPIVSAITIGNPGSGYTAPPVVTIVNAVGDLAGKGATAVAAIDTTVGSLTVGQVTAITLTSVGSGYITPPTVIVSPPPAGGVSATATATLYSQPKEVGMVPATKVSGIAFPASWSMNDTPGMTPNILDGRHGGVPDPATMGPSFIHIGSEGGVTPAATVLDNTPIGYEQNKRSVTVLNTYDHTVFLGPAERADLVVDFSQFAGKTIILYNDAPAPLPAGDPRNDYFTANPDMVPQGGAPPTQAGFGPNTRTIMQIRVAGVPAAPQGIASLTLTAPGANYTAPTVAITDPNPAAAGALATATVSPGIVSGITVTLDGFNYINPVVTITPALGDPNPAVPASATATTWIFGGVGAIMVNNPGAGYIHPPTVTITDAAGSGIGFGQWATAVATVVPAGGITGITLQNPGAGYTAPVVTISDATGQGATALATVKPTLVPAYNPLPLSTAVAAAFASTQPKPIVPESGYNGVPGYAAAVDKYSLISDTSMTYTPYGAGAAVITPLQPKNIQELFDPLGRMNATLGVELPFTTATIQTTIPYGFADPATELIPDGATQLWKITHNGVDTHAIHFHLFNVQVINRVGWDGAIKPPWPEELGWKDTVKMNPLEDIVVALRAKTPTVPFAQPDNVRPLDPASQLGSRTGFLGVGPDGLPHPVTNILANFGAEYTWHCHLLGHEENDMMRPVCVAVPPAPPSNLITIRLSATSLRLTWVDNSLNESGFVVQKRVGAGPWTTLATLPAGTVTYTDTTWRATQAAQYQVIAVNTVGSGIPGYPSLTATSVPSNLAGPPAGATTISSLTQLNPLGSPVVLIWTYSAADQTGFTVQRSTSITFPAASTVSYVLGNVLTYSDTALPGTSRTFYYRVIPTNALGSGQPSGTGTILVHP